MTQEIIAALIDAGAGMVAGSGLLGATYLTARKRARAWVASIVREEIRGMAEDLADLLRIVRAGDSGVRPVAGEGGGDARATH